MDNKPHQTSYSSPDKNVSHWIY